MVLVLRTWVAPALCRDNPPGNLISISRFHHTYDFHGHKTKEVQQSIPNRACTAEPLAGRISAYTVLGGSSPLMGPFPQLLKQPLPI